jgi:hypothetical protein
MAVSGAHRESVAAGHKMTIFLKDPEPIAGRPHGLPQKFTTTIEVAPPHAQPQVNGERGGAERGRGDRASLWTEP